MDKGFGIAALVVAILSFFIPLYAFVGSWLSLVLATIGALAGDRGFAIAVAILAPINIFLLSPSVWALLQDPTSSNYIKIGTGVLVAAPFVAMLLGKSKQPSAGQS